jgi:hypothetical protein
VSVVELSDEALVGVIAELAGIEPRAASGSSLSVEADRRRVAEETVETGTDAWLARVTGSRREQAAGGLWLAGLLREKYETTWVAVERRPHGVARGRPRSSPAHTSVDERMPRTRLTSCGWPARTCKP